VFDEYPLSENVRGLDTTNMDMARGTFTVRDQAPGPCQLCYAG